MGKNKSKRSSKPQQPKSQNVAQSSESFGNTVKPENVEQDQPIEQSETSEQLKSSDQPEANGNSKDYQVDKPEIANGTESTSNGDVAAKLESTSLQNGSAEDGSDDEDEDLKGQLEQAISERDEIQDEYDNLLEKVSLIKQKLETRFKELEAEKDVAMKESEAAKKESNDLRTKLLAEKDVSSNLATESAKYKRDADTLKAQLVSQKIMFDQEVLNERLSKENLEVELAQLTANLGDTESLALQSSQTNEAQEKEIMRLKGELETAKRNSDRLTQEGRAHLKSVEQERDLAQNELSVLLPQLEDLRKTSQTAVENEARMRSEAKENQLLIGKLRHEAVILNDHLTQALRMIRKDAEGSTVDKELVSNLFVQYATCPRQDTKKFEILQLIANFLDWDEPRRQSTGLMRSEETIEAAELPPTQMVGFVGRLAEYLESKRR